MSDAKDAHEEELVDYEEDAAALEPSATDKGGKKGGAAAGVGGDAKKGSYAGIHSSGFRDFLLKSELLLAVTDCGFEHPSEGTRIHPQHSHYYHLHHQQHHHSSQPHHRHIQRHHLRPPA